MKKLFSAKNLFWLLLLFLVLSGVAMYSDSFGRSAVDFISKFSLAVTCGLIGFAMYKVGGGVSKSFKSQLSAEAEADILELKRLLP